ncbi:MAG: hypothetical protein IBX45_08910 [Campylobacterales bacterium]|nr:hypothetical protein [Campylobacterales bacterium]
MLEITLKILVDLFLFGMLLSVFCRIAQKEENIPLAFLLSGGVSLFHTYETKIAMYENLMRSESVYFFIGNQILIFIIVYIMIEHNRRLRHHYSQFNALLVLFIFFLMNLSYFDLQLTVIHFVCVYFIAAIFTAKMAARATWEKYNK